MCVASIALAERRDMARDVLDALLRRNVLIRGGPSFGNGYYCSSQGVKKAGVQ